MQTQGITTKDFFHPEEPKTKDPKSVPPHDNIAELPKKKNKQKRFKCQQECTKEIKETPAIGNNTVDTAKKRRSVTPVRSHVLTAIRKATIQATVSSQKTSINLGNLCAGD